VGGRPERAGGCRLGESITERGWMDGGDGGQLIWLPFHAAPGEGSPVVLQDDGRRDWSQTMGSTRPVRAVGVHLALR